MTASMLHGTGSSNVGSWCIVGLTNDSATLSVRERLGADRSASPDVRLGELSSTVYILNQLVPYANDIICVTIAMRMITMMPNGTCVDASTKLEAF